MIPRIMLAVIAGLVTWPAMAQTTVEPDRCPRLVAGIDLPIVRVAHSQWAQAEDAMVRLTFIGHATFLIESPAGVTIATDYNDGVRPNVVPRIATMNIAHETHHSFFPDSGIEYLLPGWGKDGVPAAYDLTVDDVWLRNVTTNIRTAGGAVQRDANSIFVFEVAGLCIAHLGHLHHRLTDDHLKALGRIDVVLVPVDGGLTLNISDMIETLQDIQAPLIIPMHFFSSFNLDRFLGRMGDHYAIARHEGSSIELSRSTLPPRATVLVLPGF